MTHINYNLCTLTLFFIFLCRVSAVLMKFSFGTKGHIILHEGTRYQMKKSVNLDFKEFELDTHNKELDKCRSFPYLGYETEKATMMLKDEFPVLEKVYWKYFPRMYTIDDGWKALAVALYVSSM